MTAQQLARPIYAPAPPAAAPRRRTGRVVEVVVTVLVLGALGAAAFLVGTKISAGTSEGTWTSNRMPPRTRRQLEDTSPRGVVILADAKLRPVGVTGLTRTFA